MVTPSQELTNSTSESGNAAIIAIPKEGDCKKPKESLIAPEIDNDEMPTLSPGKKMIISSLEDEEQVPNTVSENDGEMATPSQELTSSSLESGIDETVAIPEENHGRKPKKSLISLEAAWAAAWPETLTETLSEDPPKAWPESKIDTKPRKMRSRSKMVVTVVIAILAFVSFAVASVYLIAASSSSETQYCK